MVYAKIIFITFIALSIGLCLWFLIVKHKLSYHNLIKILICTGLVLRLIFVFFTPTFYAPDEESHYNYINYLVENHHFPSAASTMTPESNNYEYHQPPIYYSLEAPMLLTAKEYLKLEVKNQVIILRLTSILFWLLTVFVLFKILAHTRPQDKLLKIISTSFLCLLPSYISVSSNINNDNLLILVSSTIIYFLVKESVRKRFQQQLVIGLLLGLALLTKFSAVTLVPIIILFYFFTIIHSSSLKPLLQIALIGFISVLFFTPWALRNLELYNSITGIAEVVEKIEWKTPIMGIKNSWNNLTETFWAATGIYNNIRFLPTIGIIFSLFSLMGITYYLIENSKNLLIKINQNQQLSLFTSCCIGILITIILILNLGLQYGQAQGRFLYPLLIPISFLFALGINHLPHIKKFKNIQHHLTGFFTIYALGFTGFSISIFTFLVNHP